MQRIKFFLYSAFLSISLLSCNSEMLSDVENSMEDPRVPEINVKQGSVIIPDGSDYTLDLANGVRVDETSEPVLFTIENIGTSDIEIVGIAATGDDPYEFEISAVQNEIIPAGQNINFSIAFSPTSVDLKSAVITITNNDFDEAEYTFNVSAQSKPIPDFVARLRRGIIPLEVQFQNNTTGDSDSYQWDFGDGSTSVDAVPVHIYTKPGTYNVFLTAAGSGGEDFKVKSAYVTAVYSERTDIDKYYGGKSIFIADVDANNGNDIAVANSTSIAAWENNGMEMFGRYLFEDGSSAVRSVFAGNIAGALYTDILAGGSTGATGVAYWRNAGTSWATKYVISSTSVWSVYAADLNENDGLNLDVIAGTGSSIIWWVNNNDNTFTTGAGTVIDSTFSNTHAVISKDIDSDGDNDVIAAGDRLAYWLNGGTGTFGAETNIDNTFISSSLYLAEIDYDTSNRIDIISASETSEEVVCWYNDGSGNLYVTGTTPNRITIDSSFTGSKLVYAGDLDGDSFNDVVAYGNNTIAWWKNNGTGVFSVKRVLEDNFQAESISIADMNNDGRKDVIAAGPYGLSSWDLKLPGLWYKHSALDKLYNAVSVCAADINGDGWSDIIASDDSSTVWWGNKDGDGTFNAFTQITSGSGKSLLAKDAENDGDIDIFMLTSTDAIEWCENDGTGNFSSPETIEAVFTGGNEITVDDINGDKLMDIIGVSADNSGVAFIWIQNPVHSWTKEALSYRDSTGYPSEYDIEYYSVYTCDIDKDTDIDIIACGNRYDGGLGEGKIALWLNNNNLNFEDQQVALAGGFIIIDKVSAADIDCDGNIDLVGRGDYALCWWSNNGNVTFNPTRNDFGLTSTMRIADMNNDTYPDILGTTSEGYTPMQLVLKINDGSGNFGDNEIIGKYSASVFTSDIDGDSDIDVISCPEGPDGVVWWENNIVDYGE